MSRTAHTVAQPAKPPLWSREYGIACAVQLFCATNVYLLMVAIAAYCVDVFGANSAEAGVVASSFIIGALLSRAFSGKLTMLWGYKTALFVGAAGNALFSFCYLLAPGIAVLMIVRIAHGVFFGIITTAAPTIAGEVVASSRAGEAMGYFSLGGTIASGIGPFLAMLLSSMGSYQTLFLMCAGMMLFAAVLCLFLRLPRRELTATQRNELRGFKLSHMIEAPVLAISGVGLLLYFCFGGVVSFVALFARELELAEFTSAFFVVFAVVVFSSRPLVSRIFDTRGARVILVPALMVVAAGLVVFSQVSAQWMLLLAGGIIGLGVGAVQAATLAQVTKITPGPRKSFANTTYFLLCDLGYALGPLLIGILVPSLGYRGVFIALAAVGLINFTYYLLFASKRSLQGQEPCG